MILGKLVGYVVRRLDGRRPRVVVVLLPGHQRAIFARACPNLNQPRGPQIRPSEFFSSCPNQLDRLPVALASRAASIAASPVCLPPYPLPMSGWITRTFSTGNETHASTLPHPERPLRSRSTRSACRPPLRNGRARFQRRVRNVLDRVPLFELQVGSGEPLATEPLRAAAARVAFVLRIALQILK